MQTDAYIDPVLLAKKLIAQRSISGKRDEGALDLLQDILSQLGFVCSRLPYEGKGGTYPVDNLHARFGRSGKHLAFAGHTDVVPPGKESDWSVPPFEPAVEKGMLLGRGAVDMKSSIAAWISACGYYLGENPEFDGSLSFIITGDEEAEAVNGTVRMIPWIRAEEHVPDGIIVGEPTSDKRLGDIVKIGRRGSVSFTLEVHGIQGHVAYPESADNPIRQLTKILHKLQSERVDNGSDYFPPTNLEVTSVDVGNEATNVIPARATAKFNVRFNDKWTRQEVVDWVEKQCKLVTLQFKLTPKGTAESFLTQPGPLSNVVVKAVKEVTGKPPQLTTTGGTSDARFLHKLAPTVEIGLLNQTAHQVDEQTSVEDIRNLTAIYKRIIEGFFG